MENGNNLSNPEQNEQLISSLHTVIGGVFERFAVDIKHSPRTSQELVELQTDGLLSIIVTRDMAGEPDAVSMLSQGDQAHIKFEDVYFVHKSQVTLQRSRFNDSGQSTMGFGTSMCLEVRPIEQHEMEAIEQIVAEATISTNPQAEL